MEGLMAESFREFFARRNRMDFPTKGGETTQAVLERLAETLADWADELAKRVAPP
jgi:broad specificity phosphatase PhoE